MEQGVTITLFIIFDKACMFIIRVSYKGNIMIENIFNLIMNFWSVHALIKNKVYQRFKFKWSS